MNLAPTNGHGRMHVWSSLFSMNFATALDITWAWISVASLRRRGLSLTLLAPIGVTGDGPLAILVSATASLVTLSPRVRTPGTVDLSCNGKITVLRSSKLKGFTLKLAMRKYLH